MCFSKLNDENLSHVVRDRVIGNSVRRKHLFISLVQFSQTPFWVFPYNRINKVQNYTGPKCVYGLVVEDELNCHVVLMQGHFHHCQGKKGLTFD
jgi:hypothetical protein